MSSSKTVSFKKISFQDLPGWEQETFDNFWEPFQKSCEKLLQEDPRSDLVPGLVQTGDMQRVCKPALELQEPAPEAQRSFIENSFDPIQVTTDGSDQGRFTGYFQPVLEASPTQDKTFCYPVYQCPDDLVIVEDLREFREDLSGIRIAGRVVEGHLKPYETRQEIETGALAGKDLELAWVKDPIALYFMHIQGSGCLRFEDGQELYLSYAATNGYPYTAIGKVLLDRGVMSLSEISMQSLSHWMQTNPEEAIQLRQENKSYVFFKPSKAQGVLGMQQTLLTPLRSLAVDRNYTELGTLFWIDLEHPADQKNIQRLAIGQDVGGAIKGPLRGDFFWGVGDIAGELAGQMNAKGTWYILKPKA